MWRSLIELLFPRGCCACGARPVEGSFCSGCSSLLEVPPLWRCGLCAGPLPAPGVDGLSGDLLSGRALQAKPEGASVRPSPVAGRKDDETQGAAPGQSPPRRRGGWGTRLEAEVPICPHCRGRPPPFDQIAAPFVYGGSIAEAIHRLKYRGRREVAAPLAALIVGACTAALQRAELVVPIPLHPLRRRERGYDQAALLAREVARLAQRPYDGAVLRRMKETPRQVGRSRKERTENLLGAFVAGVEVGGRSIAIVDDVVTTGATAEAASQALLDAGASQVVVLAVARAM